jgi:hypothetical protein
MGWSIGFDSKWRRDIGYGVPCKCDHPDCNEEIDRGLAHVCGGRPYGGEDGCGLYFCGKHLSYAADDDKDGPLCDRCAEDETAFNAKPDIPVWIEHKLQDESWQRWRDENPKEVAELHLSLNASRACAIGAAPVAQAVNTQSRGEE